jgi:hypothetical protein
MEDAPMRKPTRTVIWVIAIVAVLFIAAGLVLPLFQRSTGGNHRAKCISNLKQIGLAVKQYALEYEGQFPPRQSLLYPMYASATCVFQCPRNGRSARLSDDDIDLFSDYSLVQGVSEESPAEWIMVYCNSAFHEGMRPVCFVDGSAGYLQEDEFRKRLKEQLQSIEASGETSTIVQPAE